MADDTAPKPPPERTFEKIYDAALERVVTTRRRAEGLKQAAKAATEDHKDALEALQRLRRPGSAPDQETPDGYAQKGLPIDEDDAAGAALWDDADPGDHTQAGEADADEEDADDAEGETEDDG